MKISIETTVNSDIDLVWQTWNNPEDIKEWNAASEDWHTTQSSVDLREGGTFMSRMEAKDASMGFDFRGTYIKIQEKEYIEYELDDGRRVEIKFTALEDGIKIEEIFDAETTNDPQMQRDGWQSILDNFARYVESKS